jgi:hypothetical protein
MKLQNSKLSRQMSFFDTRKLFCGHYYTLWLAFTYSSSSFSSSFFCFIFKSIFHQSMATQKCGSFKNISVVLRWQSFITKFGFGIAGITSITSCHINLINFVWVDIETPVLLHSCNTHHHLIVYHHHLLIVYRVSCIITSSGCQNIDKG